MTNLKKFSLFDLNSSSFHIINADFELSRHKKILYILYNTLNILIPSLSKQGTILKFYPSPEVVDKIATSQASAISPSRFLCDAFWISQNWDDIEMELGEPIQILEVGCGTGRYGSLLSTLHSITYSGLDISASKEWDVLAQTGMKFYKKSYEDFGEVVSTQNLIITQSALEHFERDLKLMKDIGIYARGRRGNTCAIHLFPSSIGLLKFIFHGIRYYSLRMVKRLIDHSNDPDKVTIYILGGPASNFLHIFKITWRQIFLRKALTTLDKDPYFKLLTRFIALDSKWSPKNCASFYAVIMMWKN